MHSFGLVFSSPATAMDRQEQGQGSDRAALTCLCQADPADPCFPARPKYATCKLHRLTDEGKGKNCEVSKSEHWNSVRVTFNIPKDAARRLRRLAESADPSLRDLGITSVQFDGDQVCPLRHMSPASYRTTVCLQVITLTLSKHSSLSAPGTANLVLGKVSSPPPPNRSANSIPSAGDDRITAGDDNDSAATSQLSLACESPLKAVLSPMCEGRGGAGPPVITGHHKSQAVTAASAPHRRHRSEENSKSVCTVIAAQYLTSSTEPPGSSQSYLSPSSSPSGHERDISDPCSGAAAVTVTSITAATTSAPSHCLPAAIPAASFASAAVPVPSGSTALSAVIHSECNTNHAEKSADAIRVTDSAEADERIRPEPCDNRIVPLPIGKLDDVNRIKNDETVSGNRVDAVTKSNSEAEDAQATGSVMNCSEIEGEDEEEEERIGSPDRDGPCSKSSDSPSPDQDSSLRSSTSPSSTTTARTHPQGQESPADSPSHDMQLLCNTSVRQGSSSNDSPLQEQNTSPSHHSDSGIASSASQQETDPQPVLRKAIDCNNSADEHNSDDERHPDDHTEHVKNNSSSSHDEASVSSESSWRTSPPPLLPVAPLSSASPSHQTPVFKFSTTVSKPVLTAAAGPVVQTSPIVAHKEESSAGSAPVVNGTSHSNCSDDEDSSRSSATPPHASPVAPDAMSVSRPDQPDTTPDLCFNDGETRPLDPDVVVLPEPPPVRRQIQSVASGDHNYIVISEQSVVDGRDWEVRQNHRSRNNSGRLPEETSLPNNRIDQNHSDLSMRPNKRRKCSSSTSSENIQTIGLEVADRSNNNNNNSSSSRPVDQSQRSGVCSSGSAVDAPPIRNSCKFPIMNGHTYEV